MPSKETFNDTADKFVFTDAKNRSWDLSLHFGIAQRLYDSDFSRYLSKDANGNPPEFVGIDLITLTEHTISEIITNERLVYAIVWAIVQDQCVSNGLPEADDEKAEYMFCEGISGRVALTLQETFWRAVIDFRPQMGSVLSRSMSIKEKMDQMAPARIDKLMSTFEDQIGQAIDEKVDEMVKEVPKTLREAMQTPG